MRERSDPDVAARDPRPSWSRPETGWLVACLFAQVGLIAVAQVWNSWEDVLTNFESYALTLGAATSLMTIFVVALLVRGPVSIPAKVILVLQCALELAFVAFAIRRVLIDFRSAETFGLHGLWIAFLLACSGAGTLLFIACVRQVLGSQPSRLLLRRRLTVAGVAAAGALLVLAVTAGALSRTSLLCEPFRFDPDRWKAEKGTWRTSDRLGIGRALVRCDELEGDTRATVTSMLGRGKGESYDLGTTDDWLFGTRHTLQITYGPDDRVRAARIESVGVD